MLIRYFVLVPSSPCLPSLLGGSPSGCDHLAASDRLLSLLLAASSSGCDHLAATS